MIINQSIFRNIIVIFFIVCGLNTIHSQQCNTGNIRLANIQKNPSILKNIQAINLHTERWIQANKGSINLRSVETLPVVVHIIWRDDTENISDEQVLSQIAVLNEDFRKLNTNFANTPEPFQKVAADVEFEFCLASEDPNGNITNGITRTRTSKDNIGEGEDWFSNATGGKDAWDINRYINIWVCDIGDDGTLGFATPPGTAEPPESDGLVIGHQYFGTTGTTTSSFPNHLGRTTTHEMGHYFNLEHLWGPGDGGCGEDDFVEDTPLQDFDNAECPSFPQYDNCTDSGDGVMFSNYMDYTDDDCMSMFSNGQKLRMLAALEGPRASLLGSSNCAQTTSFFSKTADEPTINIYPNPASQYFEVTLNIPTSKTSKEFRLLNFSGIEVWKGKIENRGKIDLSGISNGLYFLNNIAFPQLRTKVIILK